MKKKLVMLELGIAAAASYAAYRYLKPTKCARLVMTESVAEHIRHTIGRMRPEQGGMLGGDLETGVVTHFHFDTSARTTGGTYSPDDRELTRVLIEEWNPAGIRLLGFVHSHPGGFHHLSGGDVEYAARLLKRNLDQQRLLLPIVRPATNGEFQIFPYAVVRNQKGSVSVMEMELEVTREGAVADSACNGVATDETFARVKDAYDLDRLGRCRLVCVGGGGAADYIENMSRAGVGEYILIDPDIVSETNLSTQQTYRKDIGRPKVDALADRLCDINPSVRIATYQKRVEEITDEEFRGLLFGPMGEEKLEMTLIAGLTDNFYAQARVNALALQFGVPSLCAQVYPEGKVAEVTFTYPGITPACNRCALSLRYKAYLKDGFENNATSDGTPIFSTIRLNALKGFITLAILHHGSEHPRWGNLLSRIGKRNLLQIRMDPDVPFEVFSRVLGGGDTDRILFDETVWLPQEPESLANRWDYDCPDCGGTGNLLDAKGTFEDTRDIRPQP